LETALLMETEEDREKSFCTILYYISLENTFVWMSQYFLLLQMGIQQYAQPDLVRRRRYISTKLKYVEERIKSHSKPTPLLRKTPQTGLTGI
jgi:hypothetical protein